MNGHIPMNQGKTKRVGVIVAFLASICTSCLSAQYVAQAPAWSSNDPGWSAEEILTAVEADGRQFTSEDGSFRTQYVFEHKDRFSRAHRDSILAGLERFALTSDSRGVRITAVTLLSTLGAQAALIPEEIPRRMERIYRQTSEDAIRDHVLGLTPLLADRMATIAFLRDVARQPPETRAPSLDSVESDAAAAVWVLTQMGEEGRATLRELHRSAVLRSSDAQVRLQHLAERGFPVTDVRERWKREQTPHH